jgi:hypothetical protein
MKKITALAALLLLTTSPGFGQDAEDITGRWSGVLEVQGMRLRLVFQIDTSETGYVATFDSPDQGGKDIPVTTTTFVHPDLKLEMKNIGAVYEGQLSEQVIEGTWKQGLQSLPLTLSRKVEAPTVRRPQEPARPYPYAEEEVRVENHQAGVTLAGTLTLPAGTGPHPAVILITGSGPQNRDEEVFGHQPFLVLADHLTRRGMAVLRCDDRGTGESTGDFSTSTSRDFATDITSAVAYLKTRQEVDPGNIGLIGHSEGALVATLVAARSNDIAHLVLLAGIGIPGSEFSIIQSKSLRPYSVPDEGAYDRFSRTLVDIASSSRTLPAKRAALTKHWESIKAVLLSMLPEGVDADRFIAQQVAGMTRPWAQFFVTYNVAEDLEMVDVVRISELPGLNHMFQECDTCTMDEYARIEQTWSPVALNEIAVWLGERVRRSRVNK